MLKVRVIPVLLLKSGRMVKPKQFGGLGERDVGFPATTARIYDSQDADELIFIDITATDVGRSFLVDTLRDVSENCFVPITAGGGIRTIDDIAELLRAGADKIVINTSAILNPQFIHEAAAHFGSQCVVVAIDVRKINDRYIVFTDGGRRDTGLELCAWAERVAALGAGEIFLTSIDHEGMMDGYDLEALRRVVSAVSIPVIINGGAGTRQHFVDAVSRGASAVGASSVFHFSDSNLTQVKSFLYNAGVSVRPI